MDLQGNTYICYSLKRAKILLGAGARIVDISPNRKYKGKLVFIFELDDIVKNLIDVLEKQVN